MSTHNIYVRRDLEGRFLAEINKSGLINELLEEHYKKAKPANLDIEGLRKEEQKKALELKELSDLREKAAKSASEREKLIVEEKEEAERKAIEKQELIAQRGAARRRYEEWLKVPQNQTIQKKEALDLDAWMLNYDVENAQIAS